MISVTQALNILSEHAIAPKTETIRLAQALGRVAAEPVHASVTLPPRDASAMDGYAVTINDAQKSGATLKVIAEVPAGHNFDSQIKSGETVPIFTGSPIPSAAETVIMQENVERSDDMIRITHSQNVVKHIRRAGIDFQKGDLIIPAGKRIGPEDISIAAAANHSTLNVWQRVKVACLAAGDELIKPGDSYSNGKIVNSNTSALSALITQWGGEAMNIGLAKDDPDAIAALYKAAQEADIIVPIGGASVGDYDYMRRVFTDLGGEMSFEKIAVKPGKPTWFGQLGTTPVLGLPGNPASALVCAHLFLSVLMGRPVKPMAKAKLTEPMRENGPREHYLRARGWIEKGQFYVRPFPRQDSSLLTPFLEANLLIKRAPLADPLDAGELIEVVELGTGPSVFATIN